MELKFKKQWLVVLLILICAVGLTVYITGAHDYTPRLHASAKSPDRTLTVKVYQKRLALRPIFPRMGAIAEVYDQSGKLIYEKTIYNDDDWDDTLGDAYTEITFVEEEIRIGPNPYKQNSPYTIKKSDLWSLPN